MDIVGTLPIPFDEPILAFKYYLIWKRRRAKITEKVKEYFFSWDDIPGNDNGILVEFLKQNFCIDWVETAKIEKIDDGKTIKVSTEKNFLSLKFNDEKTKVDLKINDGRTGEFIAMQEIGKIKIYVKNYPSVAVLMAAYSKDFEKPKYLFNVTVDEEENLNNGTISENLKKVFKTKGLQFPERFSIRKSDEEWGIIDDDGGKSYYLNKEDGNIKIYKDKLKIAIETICKNCYPGKIKIVVVVNGQDPPNSPNNDNLIETQKNLENWWNTTNYKNKNCELNVITLHCNEGNKAIPLNVGYKFTNECEYVITTDPKGHLVKGSIKELISYFIWDLEKKIGGVSGVITVEEGKEEEQREHSIWEKWDFLVAEWSVRWSRLVIAPHVHASGGIAAYRREVLEKIKEIRKREKGEKAKTQHIINSEITEVEEVFNRDSVVEDLEISWRIHDLCYKIEHEPKATYHGYAPHCFLAQYNRFRRWYGGFAQVFRFVGPKGKRWRWYVSFTGLVYSFFWIFVLFYMIFGLIYGNSPQLDKIKDLPNNLNNLNYLINYTPFGGLKSFYDAFKLFSVQPLIEWWTDFFQIAISEFIMCVFDFWIAIIAGYRFEMSDGKKAIPNPITFLPYTLIAPFVIVLNRFYWVIFGIYGMVSRKKLAW